RFVAEPEHGAPQEHYLDFVFQPFTDQDGSIGGLVLVGMTNSRRTRTEQALPRREAALEQLNRERERRVAEHAHERSLNWQVTPDMLGVFDRDGILERSNPAWQQVLGWSHEELAARPMRELLHPGDRGAAAAARQRLHAGEPLLGFECRMRTRDGGYRTLSWVATPQEGRFYCSARDVTAHRMAVAALAESQAQLRNLFETSFQLQGMCALDGTLLDANETALAMIGARRGEVVGRPFWDTPWFSGTPGMPERIRAGVLRAAAGELVHDELEVDLPGGHRVLELSLRPFHGADGRITGVVQEAIDITQRAPPRRRCAGRRSWRRWASSPAAWPTTSTTCWRRSWPRWTWPPIPRPTPGAAPAPWRWRSSPPSARRCWCSACWRLRASSRCRPSRWTCRRCWKASAD